MANVKTVTVFKAKVIDQFAEQCKDRTKLEHSKLLAFFHVNTSSIWSWVEIRTDAVPSLLRSALPSTNVLFKFICSFLEKVITSSNRQNI